MSSKSKQRKAVARAKYEAYLDRKADQARRHKRNQVIAGVVVVALIVGAFALWTSGVFDDDSAPVADAPAANEPTPDSKPTDDGKPPKEPKQYAKPQQVLTEGQAATATLKTNKGDITIDLETERAPENSNSLAFLASDGYFDNSVCHRLTTGDQLSVVQCGDPTGTGTGGPGYTVPDENLPKGGPNNYPAGTVAMAEPAGGDAGSQFFLVYDDSTLPPDYTVVGQIDEGLDILREIAQGGVEGGGSDGKPAKPVTIGTVTIEQN